MENEIKRAIKHFTDMLNDNYVVISKCKEQGVNPLVYNNRKKYLELAIADLE